jgi:hypothetical protein
MVNQHGLCEESISLSFYPNSYIRWWRGCSTASLPFPQQCVADFVLVPSSKVPYYKESHRRLQKATRIFTGEKLYPVAQECEKTSMHIPQELVDSMFKKGILHMRIGLGKHLHGVNIMDGVVSIAG